MSAKERIKIYGEEVIVALEEFTSSDIEQIAKSDLYGCEGESIYEKIKRRPRSICFDIDGEILTTHQKATHSIEEFRVIFGFDAHKEFILLQEQADIQKLQCSLMRRDGGEFKLYEIIEGGARLFGKVKSQAGDYFVESWLRIDGEYRTAKEFTNFDLIPRKTVYCIDIFQTKEGDKLSNHPYPKSEPGERGHFAGCEIIKTLEFEL